MRHVPSRDRNRIAPLDGALLKASERAPIEQPLPVSAARFHCSCRGLAKLMRRKQTNKARSDCKDCAFSCLVVPANFGRGETRTLLDERAATQTSVLATRVRLEFATRRAVSSNRVAPNDSESLLAWCQFVDGARMVRHAQA